MRIIDSFALGRVASVLGVGNPASATSPVLFDDENLQQTLVVNELVRRGSAPVSEGLILGTLQNAHLAAGQLDDTLDVWSARESIDATPPWLGDQTLAERTDLDLWLLEASLFSTGGTGSNLNTAILRYAPTQRAQLGLAAGAVVSQMVSAWDTLISVPTIVGAYTLNGNQPRTRRIRLSRGGSFSLASDAAGAVTVRCTLTLGLFPRGLGQDVAV